MADQTIGLGGLAYGVFIVAPIAFVMLAIMLILRAVEIFLYGGRWEEGGMWRKRKRK